MWSAQVLQQLSCRRFSCCLTVRYEAMCIAVCAPLSIRSLLLFADFGPEAPNVVGILCRVFFACFFSIHVVLSLPLRFFSPLSDMVGSCMVNP